ncbi:cupin domain-containing protein [Acetobacter sacchari]|uniref:Cupin domain-containing protein n=1 Tax=Acetobacter sacchari TaxID=2661687 RepID=A0ABS3LS30_9PROT|nr:cupin domain-containing protein [Acetobacter sacchari]MBO1358722.1 cupin domain-containing protein [Acetobacter sacchari]
MSKKAFLTVSLIGMTLAPFCASAEDKAVVLTPRQITWAAAPADFPKGVKISYVFGDVSAAGPFVIRVEMPPHTTIAPHVHNMDEMLTVISGHFTHFVGKTLDGGEKEELAAGSFLHLPQGVPHALRTGASPTVVQVSGVGPFGMTYVNPADNPANASIPAK